MCEVNEQTVNSLASVSVDVDDAVGVPEAKWFIAIVNSRNEKSVAEKLSRLGVENYLPIQEEIHLWTNGKRAKIEKVLIPAKIFIHCTEKHRREIVNLPYIFRFMTNISGTRTKNGFRPLAVVPDNEIRQLKFMLGVTDVKVTFSDNFVKGERVMVVRGPFKGLCGEILEDADSETNRLYINIDFLGSASVVIDPSDVEIIK